MSATRSLNIRLIKRHLLARYTLLLLILLPPLLGSLDDLVVIDHSHLLGRRMGSKPSDALADTEIGISGMSRGVVSTR